MDENVVDIVVLERRKEALAFVGLAHGWQDTGSVLKVRMRGEAPEVVPLLELDTAPQAVVAENGDTALLLTNDRLRRIGSDGTAVDLCAVNYQALYPRSLVLAPSGAVYVGMRHYVGRIWPGVASRRCIAEWFVPDGCRRFAAKDLDCVCTK